MRKSRGRYDGNFWLFRKRRGIPRKRNRKFPPINYNALSKNLGKDQGIREFLVAKTTPLTKKNKSVRYKWIKHITYIFALYATYSER